MTFTEFISKYNGKYIDTDNAYGGQCMDLMHQYCVEMLGIGDLSVLAAPSAKAVFETFSTIKGHEFFEQIINTPEGVPQEGDIVFWGNAPYGHVAIFVEGGTNSFKSFDQNYPTGSPCHIQGHTYSSVVGWLRFKQDSQQAELTKVRIERDRNWDWFVAVCTVLGVGANVEAAVAEAKKLVGLDDKLVQKDRQLQEAQTKITDLESQFKDLSDKHETMRIDNATLTVQVKEQGETLQKEAEIRKNLQNELQTLKDNLQKPIKTGWEKIVEGFFELIGRR